MKRLTPGKVWASLFALWGLFLSGAVANLIGSPGVLQAVRLKSLLDAKSVQVGQMQSELTRLQIEASQLEKSKVAQRREIRRVLGYAASDEIIFDFSKGDSI